MRELIPYGIIAALLMCVASVFGLGYKPTPEVGQQFIGVTQAIEGVQAVIAGGPTPGIFTNDKLLFISWALDHTRIAFVTVDLASLRPVENWLGKGAGAMSINFFEYADLKTYLTETLGYYEISYRAIPVEVVAGFSTIEAGMYAIGNVWFSPIIMFNVPIPDQFVSKKIQG